jgi:methionyl-tRNA formyltransferase
MHDSGIYRYDEGDLLEQRNSYFYSAYHGSTFLASWVAKRDAAMAQDGDCSIATATVAAIELRGQTDEWLDDLQAAFSAGSANATQRQLLAKLVQRFEVSKRLHADYTPEFKPAESSDYLNLSRYVTFAGVLIAAYGSDRKMQTLNVLLKVLDTLCALRHQLPAAAMAKLPELILTERAFVVDLARGLGVRWQPN